MSRVYDKTQAEGYFFRIPADIRHYIFMPKFKAEMIYLYGLIVDFYNAEQECAFPSKATLALHYGKTEKTTGEHLDVLEAVGLLGIHRSNSGNKYVPLKPLSQEQLFKKYPEAKKAYEAAVKRTEKEKARSKERFIEYLASLEQEEARYEVAAGLIQLAGNRGNANSGC